MNINDLGKLLGKPEIKAPKPITTQVRRITICPNCRMPHPSNIACKPGERHDNGGSNYP